MQGKQFANFIQGLWFTAFLVFWTFVPKAHCALHEQIAISTKAISLANSVTAYPPGLMSIHYNPAGLSQLRDGKNLSIGFSGAYFSRKASFIEDPEFEGFLGLNDDPVRNTEAENKGVVVFAPVANDTLDTDDLFGVPAAAGPLCGGISYREKGSKWTFAYAYYVPYVGGFSHEDDSSLRYAATELYLQHLLYAAPAASVRLTDSLSFGLSVGLGQTSLGLTTDARAPSDLVALTRILGDVSQGLDIPILSQLTFPSPWVGGGLDPFATAGSAEVAMRDDFSPSYNLGLLWEPENWFAMGLCYQSATKLQLQGNFLINHTEQVQKVVDWLGSAPGTIIIAGILDLPTESVPFQKGKAIVDGMELPQMFNIGLMFRPVKPLRIMFDLHWSNWSTLKETRIQFDHDLQLLRAIKLMGHVHGDRTLVMEHHMKDTWNYSIGVDYQIFDWLSFRAGYEHRNSSVNDKWFSPILPLPDLDIYGAGFGITTKKGIEIDTAVGYIVNKGYKVPNDGSWNLNSTDFTHPVYNPYAGLNYEQDIAAYIVSANFTMPLDIAGEVINNMVESVYDAFGLLYPF